MATKTAFKLAATAQSSVASAHPAALAVLPATLAAVALIDAETCAAAGQMSVSWWHEMVRSGNPSCRWHTMSYVNQRHGPAEFPFSDR